MNLIIDDAEEVYIGKAASKPHRPLGEHFIRFHSYLPHIFEGLNDLIKGESC